MGNRSYELKWAPMGPSGPWTGAHGPRWSGRMGGRAGVQLAILESLGLAGGSDWNGVVDSRIDAARSHAQLDGARQITSI